MAKGVLTLAGLQLQSSLGFRFLRLGVAKEFQGVNFPRFQLPQEVHASDFKHNLKGLSECNLTGLSVFMIREFLRGPLKPSFHA